MNDTVRHNGHTVCDRCARLVSSFGTVSSLVRILCWSIIFFIAIISLLPENQHCANPDNEGRDFSHPYEKTPIKLTKELSESMRIAIIGTSESIDYQHYSDGVAMAMARLLSQRDRDDITIMGAAVPGADRRWKAMKIRKALDYSADAVFVSLIGKDYFRSIEKNEFNFGDRWYQQVLKNTASPCDVLDSVFRSIQPGYKGILGVFFRGDQDAQKIFFPDTDKKNTPPVVPGPAQQQEQATGLRADTRTRKNVEIDEYNETITEEDIVKLLETMAEPALKKDVPVIFVVAPQRSTHRKSDQSRKLEDMLDRVANRIADPNLILFNARARAVVPDDDFMDVWHLKAFDAVAESYVMFLEEKGLLKPGPAAADTNDTNSGGSSYDKE